MSKKSSCTFVLVLIIIIAVIIFFSLYYVFSILQENYLKRISDSKRDAEQEQEPIWKLNLQQEEFLRNMIRNPRAILYTGKNHTGRQEYYNHYSQKLNGGCYRLEELEGQIQSVDTEGTCVRLFSDWPCKKWSQAVYPGSTVSIDPKLNGVHGIGPCASNEFDYVTLEDSADLSQKRVTKVEAKVKDFSNVPDLVPDFYTRSDLTSFATSYAFNHEYLLGYRNRLEAISAYLFKQLIRSPQEVNWIKTSAENQNFLKELDLRKGTDKVGYAIPLELGGPADERWNVFPQDEDQTFKYRRLFFPEITKHLEQHNETYVRLALNFFYENTTVTRPTGIWYSLYKLYSNEYTHGYVRN